MKVPSTADTMLYLGFNVVLKISLSILAWEAGRQGHCDEGLKRASEILAFPNEKERKRLALVHS